MLTWWVNRSRSAPVSRSVPKGEPSSRHAFETDGERPFIERQIAGDQRSAALVTLGDHLKKQLGAGLGQGHEAQFVDDQ